jgi:sec-independent protein translocase protein TatA
MGPIGVQEMIAIFLIALILFGPKKLPELGRTLGKALSEFRRAKNELKATLETHLGELEREANVSKALSDGGSGNYNPATYSHPYEDYGRRTYEPASWETHEGAVSAPEESAELQNPATSEPAATPSPASEHFDAPPQPASGESTAVPGTVPRSNGIYPAKPVTIPTDQENAL